MKKHTENVDDKSCVISSLCCAMVAYKTTSKKFLYLKQKRKPHNKKHQPMMSFFIVANTGYSYLNL